MARKRYTTEQIIGLLREAEVRAPQGQGQTIGTVCRSVGVSEQSYYRWRREYGGLKLDQAKRLKDLDRENERLKRAVWRAGARQIDPEGSSRGKILSPSRKRACIVHVRSQLDVSERRACSVVGQPRATHRRHLKTPDDEEGLTAAIVRLATRYGRYGYRRIREMLVAEAKAGGST